MSSETLAAGLNGSIDCIGVPPDISEQARKLFGSYNLLRGNHSSTWQYDSLLEVVTPSGKFFEGTPRANDFHRAYLANAALENQAVLGDFKVTCQESKSVGTIQVAIGPNAALVHIKDNPEAATTKTQAQAILENVDQMKQVHTALARRVGPTILKWLETQGTLMEPRGGKHTLAQLQSADGAALAQWISQSFKLDVASTIKNWLAKASDQDRLYAKALLAGLGTYYGETRIGQFLQDPFSSPDVIHWGAKCFPGSVFESLSEEQAIRTRAELEAGKLSQVLGRLLEGETITTYRVTDKTYGEGEELKINLPVQLQTIVKKTGEGEYVLDLQSVGTDKIGVVMGCIKQALYQLDNLTGAYVEESHTLQFTDQKVDFPEPTYPLLQPHAKFLIGDTADYKRYPKPVQQRIPRWQNKGYVMATLIAPSGIGKSTLARELSRNLIRNTKGNPRDLEYAHGPTDDVLFFEFAGPSEQEVETATQGGQKTLDELGRSTYSRLAQALEQFQKLVAGRKGKATFLVWDNFHLLPYATNPEIKRALLNVGDRLKGIGDTIQDRETAFGVFFMGEKLPDGIDEAFVAPHRFEKVIIDPTMQDVIDIGIRTAEPQIEKAVNTQIAAILKLHEREENFGRMASTIRSRGKQLIDFISQTLQDRVLSHNQFMALAADREAIPFFTNTSWETVIPRYLEILKDQIGSHLDTGKSDWIDANPDTNELQLSTQGQTHFVEQFNQILGEELTRVVALANQKLGRQIELPGQRRVEKPEFEGENLELIGALDAASLQQKVEAVLHAQQSEAARIQEQLTLLTQRQEVVAGSVQASQGLLNDIASYGTQEVLFMAQNTALETLLDEKTRPMLEAGKPDLFSEAFRTEFILNSETILSIVGKLPQTEKEKVEIAQLRTSLTVLKSLFGDTNTWNKPESAGALAQASSPYVLQLLNSIDVDRLRSEIARIKNEVTLFKSYQETPRAQ